MLTTAAETEGNCVFFHIIMIIIIMSYHCCHDLQRQQGWLFILTKERGQVFRATKDRERKREEERGRGKE